MNWHIKNIAETLGAKFSGPDDNSTVDNFSIDSRSLQNNNATLFFALSGPNNDGHHHIPELIAKGVRNFVVKSLPKEIGKANFLIVSDTLTAFQDFASNHRRQFTFPIIGVTGSNGKTIVKEWLGFLLSPDFNIIKSPKSYNSQVGVPLSVLAINELHNLGIFEAGISEPGEMERLEPVISPQIGVLTNIGPAHDEGFSGIDEKINEKLRLFENSDVVIFKKNASVHSKLSGKRTFCWSSSDADADVFIAVNKTKNQFTILDIRIKKIQFDVEIPFNDEASIENAISCLMVLLYMDYDRSTIQLRMKELFPVEMRLQVKNGINSTTIIDDSYSSDFQSLKIALDFLENQKHHSKKTVILSDIYQSGLSENELYSKVALLVKSNKISRFIGIGETISKFGDRFENAQMFADTSQFISAFDSTGFGSETILVKGSRQFKFEKITALLEEKTHETVLEINLNSISHNYNYYKAKIDPETKMMVMVKAFGYGNGGFEIAKLLEHHKTDYLGVAFADEGISLKSAGIKLPIMVLNPESTSFASIIQHDLEPEIYSLKGLASFIKICEEKQIRNYPIHIKLDTGMHRLGFEEDNLVDLIAILKTTTSVNVRSILSHMATSDDRQHHEFALSQIALFDRLSSLLIDELQIRPIRHILNSSGISNYPEAQFDMVRLGIGLYGISNDPAEQQYLQNVGTLKSVISQLRTIDKNESVGYGRRFIADKETSIATIPIGYADGISRHLGNGTGYVSIHGKNAPIVGSVCMDMLMVDCTGISCHEGDSVIIFGESPTVIEIAKKLQTIPYEILTSISQRVKRVFYRE